MIKDPHISKKVKLLVDLSSYHPEFSNGVVGEVWHRSGMLDTFFVMKLPSGACLDVLWISVAWAE